MSAEDIHLIGNEKIVNSNIKRDFLKIYHQHWAEINNENQGIKFLSVDDLNHIQRINGYL